MTTSRSPHPTPRGVETALALLALVAIAVAAPARAHQFWLSPSHYAAAPGQAVEVGAVAGTGFRGERQPWSPPHAVRFVARTSRSLDLAKAASSGDQAWARFAPSDGGGALLAFESGFTPIQLPAAAFEAYLADEGLTEPLATRHREHSAVPGRERYRRCAKAWLSGTDAARATSVAGLPLELVPQALPGAAPSLRVRVLWQGAPLAGALVKAWRADLTASGGPLDVSTRDSLAVTWESHSDARGEFTLPCARAGEWMVSVVHMTPCRETEVADWESTWGSLTFERAAADAKGSR